MTRRTTRIEQVVAHLKARGHISEGTAILEYGRFRLSDVIHRLRNDAAHLLPDGMEIITITKQDTKGDYYGEYHLVRKAAAAQIQQVLQARSEETAAVAS